MILFLIIGSSFNLLSVLEWWRYCLQLNQKKKWSTLMFALQSCISELQANLGFWDKKYMKRPFFDSKLKA